MGESKAIWDMIDAGLVGDNVNLVVENENCKVMQLADETGEGVMTVVRQIKRCSIRQIILN